MSVRAELKAQSIAALKARDKETRELLSGVLGKFLEAEKAAGFSGWTDAAERDLVSKHVKQLSATLDDLEGSPLAVKYQSEIDLLAPYLPQLLDEAATAALVAELAPQAKSLGQLMGLVMKDHKGKVDGGLVRRLAVEAGLK
jgi:uncharacterized protein YqeY